MNETRNNKSHKLFVSTLDLLSKLHNVDLTNRIRVFLFVQNILKGAFCLVYSVEQELHH